jgi:excisionase family DNA binding protein
MYDERGVAVVLPIMALFTTTEAATMLGLSRPTLMRLVEAGEIDHVKVGTLRAVVSTTLASARCSTTRASGWSSRLRSNLRRDHRPSLGRRGVPVGAPGVAPTHRRRDERRLAVQPNVVSTTGFETVV